MRIKELYETIESMKETHQFDDNATIKVMPSPIGGEMVEIGIIEDGTQIILSRQVECKRFNPVTGEDYD